MVTREVHRSSLRRLICPAKDHLICLTLLIISMTFVLCLTQMLVLLSLYVMLSILFSFWSVLPQGYSVLVWSVSSAPYVIAGSTNVSLHLSLQAVGKVVFEYIPFFYVCRLACHDSSLYLFVLVILRLSRCPKYT